MSGFRNKPAALSSGLRRNRFGLMEPIDFDVQPEGPLVAGKGSYSSPFGTLLYGLFLVASLRADGGPDDELSPFSATNSRFAGVVVAGHGKPTAR